jgi:uncharacterized caspase-like protein
MSPRPRRVRRRAIRRAARAPIRRSARRIRRRIWRRTRRLIFGGYALILIGGTSTVVKVKSQEANRIEEETNKNIEDLTEVELKSAMARLGIQNLELTSEDETRLNNIDSNSRPKKYCSYCGAQIDSGASYCQECGKNV